MGEQKKQVLCRKIQLIVVGDKEETKRVYDYLKEGMESQNKAMNQYMSALFIAEVSEATKDDRKELNRLYTRISSSKKGSAYDETIQFAKGLPSTSCLGMKVRQDFSNACKKGLMYGKVSLPSYRDNKPLLVHGDYVRLRKSNPHSDTGMYHDYPSEELFYKELKDGYPDIFIKFANSITFKMVFGNPYKSAFLREEIRKIFEQEYEICGSSIQFDRNEKGKKIILNLSISVPIKNNVLNEECVVGVNLGISCPAILGMNESFSKEFVGDKESFLIERLKIQKRLCKLQKDLKYSTSKKNGRKKRLKPLTRFHEYEKNYVKTYNHMVSKHVVKFALKNNAKYINMEEIIVDKNDKFLNRNWSYFQLQNFIEYKARMNNIVVRKVNPVDDVCSFCKTGEVVLVEDNMFTCKNEKCKMFAKSFSPDWNKSRLISQSTDFIVEEKTKKSNKKAEIKEELAKE